MKSLKLKPLLFPSDDILVKPPDVLYTQFSLNPDKSQNKKLTNLNQLITILRGRKLKKTNLGQKGLVEDEKETVKKLTEWKRPSSPHSPLTRKFTFRRTITLSNLNKSVDKIQQEKPRIQKKIIDIFTNKVQQVLNSDKLKKRAQEEEWKKLSEDNIEYEAEVKYRIEKVKANLKGLKDYIYEHSEKLADLKSEFEVVKKKQEEDSTNLALYEAQELLFKDKNKKNKPVDEAAYFIKKEKIRKMKQEFHKRSMEQQEKYLNNISEQLRTIESAEHNRRLLKKQLREHREELVMLYCRLLRDGKDARSDGLRWIIKSLWAMEEAIPISAFPKFLDEESAHFLLKHSELEIEIEVFNSKLTKLHQDIKSTRPSSCAPSTLSLYSQVKSRLKQISQCSVGRSPLRETEEKVKQKEYESPSSYSEIAALKSRISKNQEEMSSMTQNEIKRVTEIFMVNEDGEGVGLYHIIRCLVGEKVREFNKYTRSTFIGLKSKVNY